MPVRESEAIILRSFPLGEGDLLVSFLSRAHGRTRGVASGARRPKSRFGSTLEPLSYIRIWYYERETRPLVRINQTELIESFLGVQQDYRAGLALALISDVTEAVLGEQEVAEANFRLLLAVARALKAGAKPSLAMSYFALWTVRLGGWLPRLDRCARCGAELDAGAYASASVGFLCAKCRLPGQHVISQAALELARRMLAERIENFMPVVLASGAATDLMDYMMDVIEQHIERSLPARRLMAETTEPAS
jgi:DNA repair protein RecO (recombination protein O)